MLAVSAGFDTFKTDPIMEMNFGIEIFYKIGRQLAQCVEAFDIAW